jgi:hypothetical protein
MSLHVEGTLSYHTVAAEETKASEALHALSDDNTSCVVIGTFTLYIALNFSCHKQFTTTLG